jgi:hypothetical protein
MKSDNMAALAEGYMGVSFFLNTVDKNQHHLSKRMASKELAHYVK